MGGKKTFFPRPHRTRALALEERGQTIQVERRVSPACVKTCEMEEEPVRPAILCCDRPLLWISSPCTMLWGDATVALARGVNVICGDLRENWHFGGELMSSSMEGNVSFSSLGKETKLWRVGERLIDIRYWGNLKWRSPSGRKKKF